MQINEICGYNLMIVVPGIAVGFSFQTAQIYQRPSLFQLPGQGDAAGVKQNLLFRRRYDVRFRFES